MEKSIKEIFSDKSYWQKQTWHILKRSIPNIFPSSDFFYESLWAAWLSKIKQIESENETYLAKMSKKLNDFKKDPNAAFGIDPDEIFADQFNEMHDLLNNIYGAFIVTMWPPGPRLDNEL